MTLLAKAAARLSAAAGDATWAVMGLTGEPAPLAAAWRLLWAVESLCDVPTLPRARLQAHRAAWLREWPELHSYTRSYLRRAREGDEPDIETAAERQDAAFRRVGGDLL